VQAGAVACASANDGGHPAARVVGQDGETGACTTQPAPGVQEAIVLQK
jgi:hypothetical protein